MSTPIKTQTRTVVAGRPLAMPVGGASLLTQARPVVDSRPLATLVGGVFTSLAMSETTDSNGLAYKTKRECTKLCYVMGASRERRREGVPRTPWERPENVVAPLAWRVPTAGADAVTDSTHCMPQWHPAPTAAGVSQPVTTDC